MKKSLIFLSIFILLAGAFFFYLYREGKDIEINIPSGDIGNEKDENDIPELHAQAGLPQEVEAKRQAIYKAAHERNYDKLAALAASQDFSYSFGGPYPGGFSEYMKISEDAEKESPFDIIPRLLRLPYSYSASSKIYTWPSVFMKEPKNWTEEDIAMMKTLFSDEDLENYRKFGGYLYYRIGIDQNGEWIYYIAGD